MLINKRNYLWKQNNYELYHIFLRLPPSIFELTEPTPIPPFLFVLRASTFDLPSTTLITFPPSVVGLIICKRGYSTSCLYSMPKIGASFHLWSFDSIFDLETIKLLFDWIILAVVWLRLVAFLLKARLFGSA